MPNLASDSAFDKIVCVYKFHLLIYMQTCGIWPYAATRKQQFTTLFLHWSFAIANNMH